MGNSNYKLVLREKQYRKKKRAKLIIELDSVIQYEKFKCYFFVPLIFSLTYATIDATKGYKKGLIFLFCIPKNWYYFGIILVWKILFEMKISLIFGENSTKCMQNIAKNARYWRYLSILNLLLRIPKTPKSCCSRNSKTRYCSAISKSGKSCPPKEK